MIASLSIREARKTRPLTLYLEYKRFMTPEPVIQDNNIILENYEKDFPNPFDVPIDDANDIHTQQIPEEINQTPQITVNSELSQEFYRWSTNRTASREVEKPNAQGKLLRKFVKRVTNNPNIISLPPYSEQT